MTKKSGPEKMSLFCTDEEQARPRTNGSKLRDIDDAPLVASTVQVFVRAPSSSLLAFFVAHGSRSPSSIDARFNSQLCRSVQSVPEMLQVVLSAGETWSRRACVGSSHAYRSASSRTTHKPTTAGQDADDRHLRDNIAKRYTDSTLRLTSVTHLRAL